MSEAPKAVFLSYAREDAAAARRIAEALRAAGLEVWFDEAELRGGDTWDAKIRGQIGSCALFLPVISAQTQSRAEGYFRREWKQADQRTEDMGRRRAFLVPVCIDETKDAEADVPDSFLRVQWTRLPGALPTPQFVEQVKRLLSGQPNVGASLDDARGRAQGAPLQRKSLPGWTWGALTAVVIGVAVAVSVSRKPETPTPAPKAPSLSPSLSLAPPQADSRSVAVLPFTNMSEDKDSGYFADGVHEDVLTNLAKIAQLKVIARTSVMEYRNTTKKIQQIAQELGVAYILEGSVRRAGNRVRVVCQLIDGRTGQHVLAPDPYDRDLADIFAIQSEIAQGIAAKLQAALAPQEKANLERTPTANLAAYDLYLKAREFMDRGGSSYQSRMEQARALLESALQYDPQFALAWHRLGTLHLGAYYRFDQTESRRLLAKAAIEKARALDPKDGGILALQTNYFIDTHDLTQARELAARLEREFPSQASTYTVLARLASRDGDPRAAQANYRKAWNLDPRNLNLADSLYTNLWRSRRYEEAAIFAHAARDIQSASGRTLEDSSPMLSLRARGSTEELESEARKRVTEIERGDATGVGILRRWAVIRGDVDEVIRLWEKHGEQTNVEVDRPQFYVAIALLQKGRKAEALTILEKEREYFRPRLASRPDNLENWFYVAYSHALLGDKAGVDEVRRQMNLANPGLSQQAKGPFDEVRLLAWLGEKPAALAELEQRLAKDGYLESVHVIRTHLAWRPLQGDPRFEAILNDPKNNAPLF